MIDLAHIRAFCATKRRLHRFVDEHRERLAPGREWTEGLARTIEVERHPWSYQRTRSGWQFTCHEHGRRVLVRSDGRGADSFSCRELCTWLHSCDAQRYGRLNETLVENWLCRAQARGLVEDAGDPPGYFRPR